MVKIENEEGWIVMGEQIVIGIIFEADGIGQVLEFDHCPSCFFAMEGEQLGFLSDDDISLNQVSDMGSDFGERAAAGEDDSF